MTSGKRMSASDYSTMAKQRGFSWLGPMVKDTRSATFWRCSKGHEWRTTFAGIRDGAGCLICDDLSRRKTPEDYRALAERRGFEWLESEVERAKTPTGWRCGRGHQWLAAFSNVQRGTGCPVCAHVIRRISPQGYHDLAQEKGLEWIGPEVNSIKAKTYWQCLKGHNIEAAFREIRQRAGCSICSGFAKKTIDDYHGLARERGFEWLGPEVNNSHKVTWWRCSEFHVWSTSFHSIGQGSGCPVCSTIGRRKTPQDYHDLAEERGFRWLGPEVTSVLLKTNWMCSKGHVWSAKHMGLAGCPFCADMVNGRRVSLPQRKLCDMLGGKLNYQCGQLRIDVALVDERVAVEYDSWYWHASRQSADVERDQDLLEAGWRVLHVKSNTNLPSTEQLDMAIADLLAGKRVVEIVLPDWGHGRTREYGTHAST